ncbi:hypothetical protein KR018_000317, partial [Drosophila ironensis]
SHNSRSSVVELHPIGDGPHLQRPPPNQQVQRLTQQHHQHQHLRMLSALRQHARTPPLRRVPVLRKINTLRNRELLRLIDFYSRQRGGGFGASGLGFHRRRDFQGSVYACPWLMNHAEIEQQAVEEVASEDEEEPAMDHWERAQLLFQQYLGGGGGRFQRPQSIANSNPIILKLNLSLFEVKPIYDMLCVLGLQEALRLAFNEVFHMQ